MIFIEAFEARINEPFMHPTLKRKTTYKSAIKYDGYKLVKFVVEDKPFVPFSLREKSSEQSF
jgi:CRISPR-associated protein Cas1